VTGLGRRFAVHASARSTASTAGSSSLEVDLLPRVSLSPAILPYGYTPRVSFLDTSHPLSSSGVLSGPSQRDFSVHFRINDPNVFIFYFHFALLALLRKATAFICGPDRNYAGATIFSGFIDTRSPKTRGTSFLRSQRQRNRRRRLSAAIRAPRESMKPTNAGGLSAPLKSRIDHFDPCIAGCIVLRSRK